MLAYGPKLMEEGLRSESDAVPGGERGAYTGLG